MDLSKGVCKGGEARVKGGCQDGERQCVGRACSYKNACKNDQA